MTLFTFPTLKLFVKLTLCDGKKCHFEQGKYQLLLSPERCDRYSPRAICGEAYGSGQRLEGKCAAVCPPVFVLPPLCACFKRKMELLTAPYSAKSGAPFFKKMLNFNTKNGMPNGFSQQL